MKEYRIKGAEAKYIISFEKEQDFLVGHAVKEPSIYYGALVGHLFENKKGKRNRKRREDRGKKGDRGRQPAWVYHFVRAWFRWNEKEKRIGYQVEWYTKPRRSCSSDDRSCKPAGSVANVKYYANVTAVFLVNFRCRNGSSMVAFDHQSSASATVCGD